MPVEFKLGGGIPGDFLGFAISYGPWNWILSEGLLYQKNKLNSKKEYFSENSCLR